MPKVDNNGVVIPEKHVNNPGSRKYIEAEYYIDDDGVQKAKPGRVIDWDAYIQASASQCDLSQIVARYLSGDSAVINVNSSPIYGDVASMPRNINEIHDLGDRVEKGYQNLPSEVKVIFGNSFEAFYESVLQGTVESKIHAYAAAKAEAASKAVNENLPRVDKKEGTQDE